MTFPGSVDSGRRKRWLNLGDVLDSRGTKGQSKRMNVSLWSYVPECMVRSRIRVLLLCISKVVRKNTCLLESGQISDRRWDLCCFRTQFLHQFQRTPEGLVKAQKGLLYWGHTKRRTVHTDWCWTGIADKVENSHWSTKSQLDISNNSHPFYLWGHVWGSAPWQQRTAGGVGSPSLEFVRSSKPTRSTLWCSTWPCSAGWPSPWSWGLAELQHINTAIFHHSYYRSCYRK